MKNCNEVILKDDEEGVVINLESSDVEEDVKEVDPVKKKLVKILDEKLKGLCKGETNYVNILVLSISFMLLFAGFHSAQGFYTSLHENGGLVLGLLYLFYSLGSLFAPMVIKLMESKLTLIVGGQCYVLFVFLTGTSFNDTWGNVVLIASGIICGCGSSILWTAQGNIIVQSSTSETIGFCSGIFFSFFQCSIISGFFLSGILDLFKVKINFLFIILGWICMAGNLVMFLLKNQTNRSVLVDSNIEPTKNEPTTQTKLKVLKTYIASLFDTFSVLLDLKFISYIVLFFFSGYTFGFYYGTFTKQAGRDLIPWLFVDFAICGVTGAIVYGKVGDWISRRFATTCVLVSHFTSIVLLFALGNDTRSTPTWLWFVCIAFCGISNTGLNVCIYSMLGIYFKDNPPSAFAAFKVIQSMTVSFQFVTSDSFTFFQIKIILVVSVVLSFVLFMITDLVLPLDSYKEQKYHNIFGMCWRCGKGVFGSLKRVKGSRRKDSGGEMQILEDESDGEIV